MRVPPPSISTCPASSVTGWRARFHLQPPAVRSQPSPTLVHGVQYTAQASAVRSYALHASRGVLPGPAPWALNQPPTRTMRPFYEAPACSQCRLAPLPMPRSVQPSGPGSRWGHRFRSPLRQGRCLQVSPPLARRAAALPVVPGRPAGAADLRRHVRSPPRPNLPGPALSGSARRRPARSRSPRPSGAPPLGRTVGDESTPADRGRKRKSPQPGMACMSLMHPCDRQHISPMLDGLFPRLRGLHPPGKEGEGGGGGEWMGPVPDRRLLARVRNRPAGAQNGP